MEHGRDYIIADNRIRVYGPKADIVAAGVGSFETFASDYDTHAKPIVDIYTGEDIKAEDLDCKILTTFDFAEGEAQCKFGQSDSHYIFIIENKDSHPLHLTYERVTNKVRCNVGFGGEHNPSFLRFGMWFAIGLAASKHHTAAIHSSVIVANNEAIMFLGESGTGKSTHTRLWRENIKGATLLNDDSPFLRIVEGKAIAYGSPWSGKTPCYKSESYPLRAIVRLSQAPHNAMRKLRGAKAIGALLPSMPPAFAFDKELEERMIDILSATMADVAVYHLECLPNAEAARLSYNTVFGL